jgi:uncharacterized membrane protein
MSLYNHIAGQKIQRIEALSDGVFAIAMTLLVFNLKDPAAELSQTDAQLMEALGSILPTVLTYFLSFMTLGIFWTGQSTQLSYLHRYDRNLTWYSLFFLLFVSILPFTTAFLGNHIHNKISIGLYWFNIFALGGLLFFHWSYAYRCGYVLAEVPERVAVNRAIRRRILVAQGLYAAGALLCFVNTYLSILVIIVVQLNYAFAVINPKPRH